MTASTDPAPVPHIAHICYGECLSSGPRPIGHGWLARSYDGAVDEVWVFGASDESWVYVRADGRIVLTGQYGDPTAHLADSAAEAIGRVLAEADAQLTRARAAVDRLRAELASAD